MNQRGRPTLYRPDYPDLARRLCLLGGTNEELASKLSAIFVSRFWGPVQAEARTRLLTAVP
jgi:hypothetical protein